MVNEYKTLCGPLRVFLCGLCGKNNWNRFFTPFRMTIKQGHVRWKGDNQEWTHRCKGLCTIQVNKIVRFPRSARNDGKPGITSVFNIRCSIFDIHQKGIFETCKEHK